MKIHFHTDCHFFAGCENMLTIYFDSEDFRSRHDVSLSYRYSKLYEDGLLEKIKNIPIRFRLFYPDLADIETLPKFLPNPIRRYVLFFTRLTFGPILTFLQTLKIYFILRKQRPDILHINNGGYPGARSCLAASFAGKLANVPRVIMVVNNIALDYSSPSRKLGYLTDMLVRNCVDDFVCGSKFAANALAEVLKLSPEKCKSIHNGIRPTEILNDRKSVLREFGLSLFSGKIFGCVANFEKRKGHILLLSAVSALRSRGTLDAAQYKFIIEGTGPELGLIKRYIRENKLEDLVILVGHYPRIMDLMNAFDILILPSLWGEDLPNVISEAMSIPKIVIASDVAGIVEQVEHKKTGFVFTAGKVESLTKAIEHAIELCPKDYQLMLEYSKTKFNESFVADRALQEYERLYSKSIQEIIVDK